MSLATTRATLMAVVEQIVTDWTSYALKVEAPNRTAIDQVAQVDPYLRVDLDFLLGGGQDDMSDNPMVKQVGQLVITAVSKAGNGTAQSLELLDFVAPYFSVRTLGNVQMHAAEAQRGKEIKGWWHQPLLINFYTHNLRG